MKKCTKCHNEHPATLEYWHKRSYSKDGLHYYCKTCSNIVASKSRHKIRATDAGRTKIRGANRKNQQQRYQNGKYQAYINSNPLAKIRRNLSSLVYSSMKVRGWSKATKTQVLLGCTFKFLMSHLQESLPDYASYEVIHIDHILPCKCAENEDELNALQHYSNLQWLPGPENQSKSGSLPPDWQERKARLMEIYWSRSVAN